MRVVKGNNLSRVKVSNQTAIREVIYKDGPISRMEIAERLCLTLPTITSNINTLIAHGIVREVENVQPAVKSLGRKAALIDIVEDSKYFLGIEMRGALRRLCITDYRGNLICSAKDDTEYRDYEENIAATCKLAKKLLRGSKLPKKKIAGIGFCLPGLVDSQAGLLKIHPGYGWANKEIRRTVDELVNYGVPISVENNACARAFGAQFYHKDLLKERQFFAYLFVSAGIACPLVINDFHATITGEGEAGHMVMDPDGPLCSCGNHGCLEAFSSERAIIARCVESMQAGGANLLREVCADPNVPTIHEILRAQELGDESVCGILDDAIFHLGLAIANIDNFVRPQCMLIECNLFQSQKNRDQLLEIIHRNLYTATVLEACFSFMDPDEFSGAKGAATVAIHNDMEVYVE